MSNKMSYRGAVTEHGGYITDGMPHNVRVMVDGQMIFCSITGDGHVCPPPPHPPSTMTGTAFASIEGIPIVIVGHSYAGCGSLAKGEADNTFSDPR